MGLGSLDSSFQGNLTNGATPTKASDYQNIHSPLESQVTVTKPQTLTPSLPSTIGFDLQDMHYLHHYTMATWSTFSHESFLDQIWREIIPQEAFSHDFLMRELLAVGALHLASEHSSGQQSYIESAVRHQHHALALVRPLLETLTPENCTPLFAFSSFLCVSAFALPCISAGTALQTPVKDMLELFTLLRGMHTIAQQAWEWLKEGRLRPLFWKPDLSDRESMSSECKAAINQLRGSCEALDDSDEFKKHYLSSIQELEFCFRHAAEHPGDVSYAMAWPIHVSDASPAYVAALKERRPMALVILGYFGVVLHGLDCCWWLQGWGKQLVPAVGSLVDGESQLLMVWPLAQVGTTEEI